MINKMYREKRSFVEKLNRALVMLPGVKDVEYHLFSEKYSEFVRVIWEDENRDFIDVTANSKGAILLELTRLITDMEVPTGLIKNEMHKTIIDEWFASANQE